DSTNQALKGKLPGGAEGVLRVTTTASERKGSRSLFTEASVSTKLAESKGLVPTLLGHDADRSIDPDVLFEDLPFARRLKAVHFESVTLDRRFDLEVNPAQDENFLRRLFPPSFINWLAETAPENLSFGLD